MTTVIKVIGWCWGVMAILFAIAACTDRLWIAAFVFLVSAFLAIPIVRSREFLARHSVQGRKLGWLTLGSAVVGFLVIGITGKETPERRLAKLASEKAEVQRAAADAAAEQKKAALDKREAERLAKAQAAEEAEKRKSGFHCLSSWNGSHREIVNSLKESLREPDSFEHIETRITPTDAKGNHMLMMKYRARNGFGGMALGQLAAVVKDEDCSFEIVANTSQ